MNRSKGLSWFFQFLVALLLWSVPAHAAPHDDFAVPPRLRPRVNFWKNVFTKYGAEHLVFHHRDFPQVIFRVLDLSKFYYSMDTASFNRAKKSIEATHTAEIKAALTALSEGAAPSSTLERHIAHIMSGLGKGTSKYASILNEDLLRTQTGIRDKFGESIRRSGRYLPMMEQVFRDHGLPIELTRLPFIESSFDYTAYSSVGAAGIWQFMPATARSFMKVGTLVDERRDPLISTRAAAQYLGSANRRLESWPLAITSYNHGVAGVAQKVRQAGTTDISKIIEHPYERYLGFASRNFFPEFLAALEVYKERRTHFPQIELDPPVRFWKQTVKQPLSIRDATRAYRVEEEDLRKVNYALSSSIWDGRQRIPKGYSLNIPLRQGETPKVAVVQDVSSFNESTLVHKVRPGESLADVARRYEMSVAELQKLNDIRGIVGPGQQLVVRRAGNGTVQAKAIVSERGAPEIPVTNVTYASDPPKPPIRTASSSALSATKMYKVRAGETLSTIAKKTGTSVASLKSLNGISGARLRVGQNLKVGGGETTASTPPSERHETPTTSSLSSYIVSRGDTLATISKKTGVSVAQLKQINGLRNSTVKPGQKLMVATAVRAVSKASSSPLQKTSPSKSHIVKRGEALATIAKRYSTSVDRIKALNKLGAKNTIKAGQRIAIP